jgi:hypothetical protein
MTKNKMQLSEGEKLLEEIGFAWKQTALAACSSARGVSSLVSLDHSTL